MATSLRATIPAARNSARWIRSAGDMYEQLIDLKVIEKPFDPATAYTLQFIREEGRTPSRKHNTPCF